MNIIVSGNSFFVFTDLYETVMIHWNPFWSFTAYSCHGSWEDNGTNYLIASPTSRKSVGARRFCFIYMATDTTTAAGGEGGGGGSPIQVASVAESCKRNINPVSSAEWAFNLTLNGM
jgi:hypothetical protein